MPIFDVTIEQTVVRRAVLSIEAPNRERAEEAARWNTIHHWPVWRHVSEAVPVVVQALERRVAASDEEARS